jgi:hypothetical protein
MRRFIATLAVSLAACGGGFSVDDFMSGTSAQSTNLAICGLGIAPAYAVALGSAFRNDEATTDARHAVASGRVKFDAAHAKACLDKFLLNPSTCFGPAASSTTLFDRVPLDCTLIFTGTVADGGTCYGFVDCISGSCDQSNSACPGKCRPTAREGGSCTDGACPRGLVCVSSSAGRTCQQPGAAGARCDGYFSCKEDLICLNHACAARVAQGGACSNPGECADGLFCNGSPGGTCQPRVDAGGACASTHRGWSVMSEMCKGRQLCLGETNSAPGRCATPQDAGGPCSRAAGATGLNAGCLTGLVCDAATSKCLLAPKAGQPCPDHLCDLVAAYCGGNGTCLAKVADGQACTMSEQCSPASECDLSGRICVSQMGHPSSCREP